MSKDGNIGGENVEEDCRRAILIFGIPIKVEPPKGQVIIVKSM